MSLRNDNAYRHSLKPTRGIVMKLRIVFAITLLAATVAAQQPAESGWKVDQEKLRTAQRELRRRGNPEIEPNGRLDRRTRTAIAAYQSVSGLPITSRLDRPTYESLTNGALPAVQLRREPSATPDEPVQRSSPDPGVAARTFGSIKSGLRAGTRGIGRSARQLDRTLLTRDDEALLREVRELLDSDPATLRWGARVRDGLVTVRTDPQNRIDNGPVIAGIRRIAGVRSVLVIAL